MVNNLQDLKVAKPELVEPEYAPEFLVMMTDAAYETLRAYLERKHEKVAVRLLDSLVVMEGLRLRTKVTHIDNQMAGETLAMVSKEMSALGFEFGELENAAKK